MILHFLLVSASASSYYIPPFQDFVNEATVIARGTVNTIHTENTISNDGKKIIYTYASFDLKEVFKGNITAHTIQIRKLGGTKDGYTLEIPGSAEFKEGEDTVFFFGPEQSDHAYEVLSLELGKYSIETKNGQEVLAGGIFNFSKPSAHTQGEMHPENQKPWTLADLRTASAKPIHKLDTSPSSTSSPALAGLSPSPFSSNTLKTAPPPSQTALLVEGATKNPWKTLALVLGWLALLIFFFRKR